MLSQAQSKHLHTEGQWQEGTRWSWSSPKALWEGCGLGRCIWVGATAQGTTASWSPTDVSRNTALVRTKDIFWHRRASNQPPPENKQQVKAAAMVRLMAAQPMELRDALGTLHGWRTETAYTRSLSQPLAANKGSSRSSHTLGGEGGKEREISEENVKMTMLTDHSWCYTSKFSRFPRKLDTPKREAHLTTTEKLIYPNHNGALPGLL